MTKLELPEIDILRRDLDKDIGGKKIKLVDAPSAATIKRGGTKKTLAARLVGAKLEKVQRKGDWIVIPIDTGDVLMMRFGERAYLRRNQAKDAMAKGTAVVVTFTQGGQLRLIDPTKSSEFFVATPAEVADIIGSFGLDLADEPVSWTKFGNMLLSRPGTLKSVLMDPTMLVGIGPLYSDEILFEAELRYDREPKSLTTQEIRRLYRAAVEVIHEAHKHGGTTIGDDGLLTLAGNRGGATISVHGRDGDMSPRARGPIVKAKFGSGYTYFCEQTQR